MLCKLDMSLLTACGGSCGLLAGPGWAGVAVAVAGADEADEAGAPDDWTPATLLMALQKASKVVIGTSNGSTNLSSALNNKSCYTYYVKRYCTLFLFYLFESHREQYLESSVSGEQLGLDLWVGQLDGAILQVVGVPLHVLQQLEQDLCCLLLGLQYR